MDSMNSMNSMDPMDSMDEQSADAKEERVVTLISADGKKFEVLRKHIVPFSVFIKTALTNDPKADSMQLSKIFSEELARVIEFANKHKGKLPTETIKRPISSLEAEKFVTHPWHATFINSMSVGKLNRLIMAANNLDCAPLMELCAAKIAANLKLLAREASQNKSDYKAGIKAYFDNPDFEVPPLN